MKIPDSLLGAKRINAIARNGEAGSAIDGTSSLTDVHHQNCVKSVARRSKPGPPALLKEYEHLRKRYSHARNDLKMLRGALTSEIEKKYTWQQIKSCYLARHSPELIITDRIDDKRTTPGELAHAHLASKYSIGRAYIYRLIAKERARIGL